MKILKTFSLSDADRVESDAMQNLENQTNSKMEESQTPEPLPGPSRRMASEPILDPRRVSQLHSKIKRLNEENSELKLQLFRCREAELPGKVREIEQLTKLSEKLLNDKNEVEEIHLDTRSTLKSTQEELQSVKNQNEQLQNQLVRNQRECERLDFEYKAAMGKITSQKLDLDEKTRKIDELQKVKFENVVDLQSELKHAFVVLNGQKSELEKLNEKGEKLKLENSELVEKVTNLETNVKALQSEKLQKERELIEKEEEINSVTLAYKKWWIESSVGLKRLVGESGNIDGWDDQANEPPRLEVTGRQEKVRVARSASSSLGSFKQFTKRKRLNNADESRCGQVSKNNFLRNKDGPKRSEIVQPSSHANMNANGDGFTSSD